MSACGWVRDRVSIFRFTKSGTRIYKIAKGKAIQHELFCIITEPLQMFRFHKVDDIAKDSDSGQGLILFL